MKLIAFRIKNFRSIKDTGWHNLAYDNITCLIGQNESGKTSVLEGLKAFYDARLIEDMLRSDLSLPEVSCKFRFDMKEFKDRLDLSRIHPSVKKKLDSLESISITRYWDNDLSSHLSTGEELNEIYKADEDVAKAREANVEKLLQKVDNDLKKLDLAIKKAQEKVSIVSEKYEKKLAENNALKKSSRSFFSLGKKGASKDEDVQIEAELENICKELEEKKRQLQEKEYDLASMKEKQKLKDRILAAQAEIHNRRNELAEAKDKMRTISNVVGIYPSERELRAAEATQEQYRLEIEVARDELNAGKRDYEILLVAADKVFSGDPFENAISQAREEISKNENFMSPNELGEEIFKFCPDYEMFEDFSSLLPNRIDLEDIIVGNNKAEGYKAAINFLTITGLDYSFFQQPSSRILKQKIENLNGELTLNFQDFWRQNVGKNNKIKINFELANYDHSHGDKSGKPYIEFWIKDESERLYPKQRSRGVRWFLSFFMELKATALDQSRKDKILLIDEPGVSLHARAQEDVLMVFDDIKDQMQIIYSTHSPHLIDVNKLYRVIAVQRAVEDDMKSETVLLNARSLRSATADTLSPVYAMMGARLNQQDVIKSFNNVIVKDLATYYFLKAILVLTGYKDKECHFLPASGTASMPMMINILIGWGLEYVALNFGNDEEKFMYNKLRKELFDNNVDLANQQLIFLREYADTEDLFSTIDFKKYVVHVREGITVNNSEYLKDNSHSRAVISSNFLQTVNRGELKFKDLDEESRDNLTMLVEKLSRILK